MLFFQLGHLNVPVHFVFLDSFALLLLVGTSFIDMLVKEIFPL